MNKNREYLIKNSLCFFCEKKGLYQCSACHVAIYCSAECQHNHWGIHKNECYIIKQKPSKGKENKINLIRKSNTVLINDYPKGESQYKLKSFNFNEKILKILYTKEHIDKLTIIHSMLIHHRNHLIENILIEPKVTSNWMPSSYYYKIYIQIESYIYHYILLVKFLFMTPNKEIKINNVINFISNEIFNGILTTSINFIINNCIENFKVKIPESVYYSGKILISYLKVISTFIKITSHLNFIQFYKKYLIYYGKIYQLLLNGTIKTKKSELDGFKTLLYNNIANSFIQHDYFSVGEKLFHQIINIQKKLEFPTNLLVSSLFNLSVISFSKNDLDNAKNYIDEAYKIKYKEIYLPKYTYSLKSKLSKIQYIKILIFYAEIQMETDNLEFAVKLLKEGIEIIKQLSLKKERSCSKIERRQNKGLAKMKTPDIERKSSKIYNRYKEREPKQPENFETILSSEDNIMEFDLDKEDIDRLTNFIAGLLEKINCLKIEKDRLSSPYNRYSQKLFNNKLTPQMTKFTKQFRLKNCKTLATKVPNSSSERLKQEIEPNPLFNPTYISQSTSEKVFSYLKEAMQKKKLLIDRQCDASDFRDFFLLMTKLSFHQIELLNETQSTNMPMSLFKNLPILFSKQFKNSLNPSQREQLDKLKVLSLIRCKILKDVNKPITVENLKYEMFQTNVEFNEFQMKKYTQLQEIISKVVSLPLSFSLGQDIMKKNLLNNNENKNEIYVPFKYLGQYNVGEIRQKVINNIKNNFINYIEDEMGEMIEIIESNFFIRLLNEISLSEIKELEEEPELLAKIIQDYLKKSKEAKNESDDNNNLFIEPLVENQNEEDEKDEENDNVEESDFLGYNESISKNLDVRNKNVQSINELIIQEENNEDENSFSKKREEEDSREREDDEKEDEDEYEENENGPNINIDIDDKEKYDYDKEESLVRTKTKERIYSDEEEQSSEYRGERIGMKNMNASHSSNSNKFSESINETSKDNNNNYQMSINFKVNPQESLAISEFSNPDDYKRNTNDNQRIQTQSPLKNIMVSPSNSFDSDNSEKEDDFSQNSIINDFIS